MKRFLLSAFAVMALGSGLTVAQDATTPQITFGYCGDKVVSSLGGTPARYYVGGAMMVDQTSAEKLKGNQISAVRVGFGRATFHSATLFITKDFKETPVYTQNLTDLAFQNWTECSLTTPYELDGEPFYIGYYIQTSQDKEYPIGFDGIVGDAAPYTGYLGSSNTNVESLFNSFESYSHQFGHLCLRLVVTGDNLPEYDMEVINIETPATTSLNTPFAPVVTIRNTGSKAVTSLEVSLQAGDEAPVVKSLTDLNLSNFESIDVAFEDFTIETPGYAVPITASVTKINGEDPADLPVGIGSVMASNDLHENAVVIEEGTGTWCGFCVRGYWGMETMKEKYGDTGRYVGIAVHSGGNPPDPMILSSYNGYISNYISGFPQAWANRQIKVEPAPNTLEEAYLSLLADVEASIKVDGEYDDTRENLRATVTTNFCFDFDEANYGICVVVTEDNLGPYPQTNYYSGGGYGPCGGFESKPQAVALMFNEVPRYINAWNGAIASVPSVIKAGEDNVYTQKVNLSKCTNLNNCNLIAMLLDRNNDGRIITATSVPFSNLSGVKNATASHFTLAKEAGAMVIDGEFDYAEFFDLNGRMVNRLATPGRVTLPSGVYLVRVAEGNNVETIKVIF